MTRLVKEERTPDLEDKERFLLGNDGKAESGCGSDTGQAGGRRDGSGLELLLEETHVQVLQQEGQGCP